jgi:hypothetical protein
MRSQRCSGGGTITNPDWTVSPQSCHSTAFAVTPLHRVRTSEIVVAMTVAGSDFARVAVLDGGPMDGTEHTIEDVADELCVVMTDGQQHRYLRTDDVQPTPDGRTALIFRWNGRYFGPK